MKNNPLVSVAIITYNQKEFLIESIESVLSQTYKNIEIVIADDGSTDGTPEILKAFDQKYPHKFNLQLSPINQGITKNCNLAYLNCKGKYIAGLGGDDLMLPQKIEKQVNFMEAHPECSICYHNLDVFDSETGKTLYFHNEKFPPKEGGIEEMIKYNFAGACSIMIRSEKMPPYGFDERLPIVSDWLFWIDLLSNGGKINYIDKILGKYRVHASSITSFQNNKRILLIQDQLNACNIVLTRYPQYFKEIFQLYFIILKKYLSMDSKSYLYYFLLQCWLKPRPKALAELFKHSLKYLLK